MTTGNGNFCRFITLVTGMTIILQACSSEPMSSPQAVPKPQRQSAAEQMKVGEQLFNQFCASCHPDGDNVSDPSRTLRGSSLRANHLTTSGDIVRIMRNPISRMIRFDRDTISDSDATAIAEYILHTFK